MFLNGGTLTSAGTISGGKGGSGTLLGAAGDAVQFGTVASTLIVNSGAVFNGQVAANSAVNDVLELAGNQSGGTGITLGAQFTGFSTLDFASGAAWKVNVDAGASSNFGMTVEGFAIGNTMDVTNAAPAVVAADFNATTNVLSTASDGTLSFVGISGEQFLLSDDGGGGTNLVLAHDPITTTLTLGSGGYPSSLIITSTGAIAPTSAGATGVVNAMGGSSLTNFGSIHGAASTSGSGGMGASWAAVVR